ncbi:MAG: hypothetical protein RIQ68_1500 [Pseudomonadota bacterium]|jgi:hypothetical protein
MRAISPPATPRARSWLAIFAGSFGLILLILAGLIFALRDQLPPPKFSGNVAFNEKIRWARTKLQAQECDTLVLGSSIALNNVDAQALESASGHKVMNLGTWGLEIAGSAKLFDALVNVCTPKRVILPIYYGDFAFSPEAAIPEAPILTDYLRSENSSAIFHYIRHGDLFGLWKNYRAIKRYRSVGPTNYQHLVFDHLGSALLACDGFKVDAQRWNGYQKRTAHIEPEAIKAFDAFLESAQRFGVKVTVAETPMRAQAREALQASLHKWRETLTKTAAKRGAHFLPPPSDFGDELFADYTHLNACGAQAWTRLIAQEAKLIP